MTYLGKQGGGEGDVRMLDPCGGRAEQRRQRRIYRVVAAAQRARARGEGRARGVQRRHGVLALRAREGTAGRAVCERGGPGARRAVAGRMRGVRAREATTGRAACGGGATFDRASVEGRARGVWWRRRHGVRWLHGKNDRARETRERERRCGRAGDLGFLFSSAALGPTKIVVVFSSATVGPTKMSDVFSSARHRPT
jgi:hypothetical protein